MLVKTQILTLLTVMASIITSHAQTVSISSIDGAEGTRGELFTVSLDEGINTTGAPITGWIHRTGTANYEDYTMANPFSIPEGKSKVTMIVVVFEDEEEECDETIIAKITQVSTGSIGISTATATIKDNECTASVDPMGDRNVIMHPNPIVSTLNFEAEQKMISYSIIDVKGRVVSEGAINKEDFQLDATSLVPGSYIVKVLLEDGNIVYKKMQKN